MQVKCLNFFLGIYISIFFSVNCIIWLGFGMIFFVNLALGLIGCMCPGWGQLDVCALVVVLALRVCVNLGQNC